MKRFILLIALLLPFYAMAAEPVTSKIANKYSQTDGVTVVNLEGAMLQAVIASEAESDEDAAETLKYIKAIKVLNCEDNAVSVKLRKEVNKLIKKSNLKPFILVEKRGVQIFTNQDGDIVNSIVVYVIDGEKVILVEIIGNFTDELLNELIDATFSI